MSYHTRIAYDRLYRIDVLEIWLARHINNGEWVLASMCADRILNLKGYR